MLTSLQRHWSTSSQCFWSVRRRRSKLSPGWRVRMIFLRSSRVANLLHMKLTVYPPPRAVQLHHKSPVYHEDTITVQILSTSDINPPDHYQIKKRRAEAYAAQLSHAERMVNRKRVDLNTGVSGDNMAAPILAVDRGRGDARNILCVIINRA
ncbi:hypothetical protein GQR58_011672 [Nymphon striatum]|nr:hypothetical protein GQR58_011672 [Nymphon striatum]